MVSVQTSLPKLPILFLPLTFFNLSVFIAPGRLRWGLDRSQWIDPSDNLGSTLLSGLHSYLLDRSQFVSVRGVFPTFSLLLLGFLAIRCRLSSPALCSVCWFFCFSSLPRRIPHFYRWYKTAPSYWPLSTIVWSSSSPGRPSTLSHVEWLSWSLLGHPNISSMTCLRPVQRLLFVLHIRSTMFLQCLQVILPTTWVFRPHPQFLARKHIEKMCCETLKTY